MSELRSQDRGLLGDVGLAMAEADYCDAIAGMGRAAFSWRPAVRGLRGAIAWDPDVFERNRKRAMKGSPGRVFKRPSATRTCLVFATQWRKSRPASPRVAIVRGRGRDGPDRLSIVRILSRPSVNAGSVFLPSAQSNATFRWEWPLRVAALAGDASGLDLSALGSQWPASTLMRVQTSPRDEPRSEVLVVPGGAREALRRLLALPHRMRAGHVFLQGPHDVPWAELQGQLSAVLAETRAAAVSLVRQSRADLPAALNAWVRELSHNEPYDVALTRAFPDAVQVLDPRIVDAASLPIAARALGRWLRQLPPHADLQVPPHALNEVNIAWTAAEPPAALGETLEHQAESLPFDMESRGGTTVSEVSRAERSSRRETAATEAVRVLQGDLFEVTTRGLQKEERGFVVGQPYRLEVFIGPEGMGALSADKPFPDADLDWDRADSFTLKVVFSEPTQWKDPMLGTLELSRFGSSTRCAFNFTPTTKGRFVGRVTVHYRGRVLQTALLETIVTKDSAALAKRKKGLSFAIETQLRGSLGTLDDRRRFDACLVLNDSSAGVPTMQAAAEESAFIRSLAELKPQLANISALLTTVALNARDYGGGLASEANTKLFRDLAVEGNWLYRNLVLDYIDYSSAAEAIKSGEHLQIVSAKPDAVVPLEFVYQYPRPFPNAPVCEHAAEALRDGACPASCAPTGDPTGDQAAHVCPMGFWGLRKVIERHLHNPKLVPDASVAIEPIAGRDTLSLDGNCVVAASSQVDAPSKQDLQDAMKRAWTGRVVAPAGTWSEWKDAVARHAPVLLLALPHSGGPEGDPTLEISGDVLASGAMGRDYVRAGDSRPIMLLLGCDTVAAANTAAYARHVAVFRNAKAALVLGTVATVLGNDVAKVAAKLVTQLSTAAESSERFGEILREVKREALLDSLPVAMCLVAFGDADWRLAPRTPIP